MSLASSLNRPMRRAAIATCTPSAASPLAMARPMPWLAPVTRAVFPARCRSTMLAFSAGKKTPKRALRERPCERQANNHFDEIAPPHADGLPDLCNDRAIRSSMKSHRLEVRTDHGPLARPVFAYGLAAMDVTTIHTVGPGD